MSVTVSISGNASPTITATTGDTIDVTVSPAGAAGPQGVQGATGPANSLSIGTVTGGSSAAATITGTAPSQTLSLVLPAGATGAAGSVGATGSKGDTGPANSLSIGTVTSGTAAATITGTSPTQTLNLVLPVGATGATGAAGATGPAANLADETPQPLGTASAGTALSAARADHVHSQGSIAYSGLSGIPSTFAPSAHSHAVSDVTGLQTALDGKQAAGTYATLVSGTVPSSQLPSYVDDVVEYANLAAFTEQSTGKIFVARDTGKIYRWSGSAYIEISPSPGSTDSVTEGSTNLYHTTNRAAAAAPVQSVAGRTGTVTLAKADVGLGSADNTADTAKPISTATQTALDGKAATSHTHSLANITQSSATTGQVPTWDGTAWSAATPSGGGSANIVEATTAAGFPATGSAGTLYHATNTSRIYFWDSSSGVYVEAGTSGGGSGGGDGTDSVLRSLFVPPAPTSVTATGGNAQASLSWTAPTVLAQTPVTDYTVQFSSNSGSSWTTFSDGTSTATSATITGLTNGTAYVFRVAAVNGVGTGSYSSASSSVTPALPPVITISSQPSSQTASSGAATFSVTASVTLGGTLAYQWQRRTNYIGNWLDISGANSSSLAVSSQSTQDNGNQYRVVVSSTGAASVTSNAATLTVASFTPTAVLLTSGTSYTVPSGATSMKAFAVGGGGGDSGSYGFPAGGCAYKTWSVSGGASVTYAVGASGRTSSGGSNADGGTSSVTYGGVTISAYGGGGTSRTGGSFTGGDGGAAGGNSAAYFGSSVRGAAVGGNAATLASCGRRPATDVSGLFAAVALAGGKTTEDCGATAAFGSGGWADKYSAAFAAGYGGGGGRNGSAFVASGPGAVVLYFT